MPDTPKVSNGRSANMRLQNYRRFLREGKLEKAAEYAANHGIPPEAPPVAPPAPVAAEPSPAPTVQATRQKTDFEKQMDAAIMDDVDAVAPPLKPQASPTAPIPSPERIAAGDFDFTETPKSVAVAPAPTPLPMVPPASAPKPWPDKSTGEIIRQCWNPALVVVRIADGRETTMWNYGQRPWQIGAKNIKLKINQRRGSEAIYETDWAV